MLFKDFLSVVKNSLKENLSEIDKCFTKPESVRNYRPENGAWTINEILEHVKLTNDFLLILINKAKDKAVKNPSKLDISHFEYEKDVLEKLEDIGRHKSFHWIRPEHMEPKGDISLDEVREKIKEQEDTCLKVLELLKNGEGLDVKTKMSVNDLGKIDVYQYIYFLSLHAKRHIEQMKKNEEKANKNKV
jgi:hypothetical protein